jgi:hypothetical protein
LIANVTQIPVWRTHHHPEHSQSGKADQRIDAHSAAAAYSSTKTASSHSSQSASSHLIASLYKILSSFVAIIF